MSLAAVSAAAEFVTALTSLILHGYPFPGAIICVGYVLFRGLAFCVLIRFLQQVIPLIVIIRDFLAACLCMPGQSSLFIIIKFLSSSCRIFLALLHYKKIHKFFSFCWQFKFIFFSVIIKRKLSTKHSCLSLNIFHIGNINLCQSFALRIIYISLMNIQDISIDT